MSPKELRSRRLELGLEIAELARRLGVPAVTVAAWEKGEIAIESDPVGSEAIRILQNEQGSSGPVQGH
ncbi:MAG TPA: helix-turn-helix domain-containing protein [Thermoanaerobaculia bacterium]|nr:helix-turn-helix domain-containing protein [Thermoanaerobaculia bacterium]